MANDLKIVIGAFLNEKLSKTALQGQLDKISKDLKVTVGIDPKQLKDFENSMKSIQDKLKNLTAPKIIPDQEEQKIKDVYRSLDEAVAKYKEFGAVKISRDSIDPITKQVEQFTLTVQKSETEVEKLRFKLASLSNIQGLPAGSFVPIKESSVDTTLVSQAKQTQQLTAEKERLRQELVKLGQTGNVTSQQLATIARSVNQSQDLSGIQKANESFKQLQSQAKLAEQMAQGREKAEIARQQAENKSSVAQQQAINKNLELMRQQETQEKSLEAEIKRRLDLYQREKQLQSQNLQSRYGDQLNQTGLSNAMSSITGAQASDFKSLEELKNFEQESNTAIRETTAGLSTASAQAKTFGEALKSSFSSIAMYAGTGMILMQSLQFFRDGIGFVNELNKSLTEISIVSGQNQQQVNALGDSYNKLAQQMGVTSTEIASTAASLYRQGLSADQTTSRMKTIIEYAKISSLDINTASEIMTAAINSMGVSATKAADVWSYMGDATATGADEIGRAMQKVGGSAGSLGIDFNKVSSWIATISSRTRESAETIGQSVNIYADLKESEIAGNP